MATPKLCLIDAFNQIHRAYHALPELTNSAGVPTHATLGFTTMVRKLLADEQPAYCAVIFDAPGPTHRHAAFEDYKKSRSRMPDDLRDQIPWIRRVCAAFGLPMIELDEYEADDVIGTLAKLADAQGIETYIVSEDKDLMQLVTDGVKVFTERNQKRIYDIAGVEEKLGVLPSQVPDLLGLMGDTSDDIPGVPQIGPKRARDLLDQFGSLEAALEHAAEFDRYAWGRNLVEYADQARLSKELATVHTDLPLELDLEAMEVGEPDRAACREIFIELEFKRLIDDFQDEPEEAAGEYVTVVDETSLTEIAEQIRAAGEVGVALLTDRPEAVPARIVGAGLAWSAGSAAYVPLGHAGLGADNAMSVERFVAIMEPVLVSDDVRVVGHDLKRDLIVLERHGLEDLRPHTDAMIASYVLHPTRSSHGLEGLALDLLRITASVAKEVLPAKTTSFEDVPVAEATRFGAERADLGLRLSTSFEADLAAQPELAGLLHDLEMPLERVLADMELRGVRIDCDYLADMSRSFAERIDELQGRVFEAAGRSFNLNSPKQLGEVLFDELELPVGGKTAKTGKRSTKAEVLEALAEEHPIARDILDYRELSKLKGTYLDALPGYVVPETGRVHASFDQAVAATGRLSSSNPNLQNIPIRSAAGREIRRAFVPADGHVLLAADYSQIELRILAHLSGDEGLARAFREGFDIHRATAAEIFQVDPDDVTYEQRDRAKVINFGVLYGMGPQRIAREFGVTTAEAKDFIQRYLGAYPSVKAYLEGIVERAREDGYVTTLLGRVRHLPELQSGRPMTRAFGERIAVNTPIQGTAADLIKLAMVNLHRRLGGSAAAAGMIVQVHDELVLEVPAADVDEVAKLVREEMEQAIDLDVPLRVDLGTGDNWMDAKA